MLIPTSVALRDDGKIEKVDHTRVPKTTETDNITQEFALLTSIVNERVLKLESAIVGFTVVPRKNILVAIYLLRTH
jgi:hypothetical protein